MDDHWEIQPNQGIGPIAFGMSEEAVLAIASEPFGEVEAAGSVGQQSDDEAYRILVDTMGEEAAREAMGVLAADGISFKPTRRVNFVSGLMLDFVEDELNSIMCHGAASDLHISGQRFFGVDPVPALRRLQALNEAPPLVKGADCHFRQLNLTAFECLVLLPAGMFRATAEGTNEALQKSVGWSRAPRQPNEGFSEHTEVDLGA